MKRILSIRAFSYKILTSVLLSMACNNAMTEDHLVPEDNQFTGGNISHEYHALVTEVFAEFYKQDVIARVIVLPSFELEYAIGIKEINGSYELLKVTPELDLWGYHANNKNWYGEDGKTSESGVEYPDSFTDIKLNRCSIHLPTKIVEQLLAVWESMLLETRYEKSFRTGYDGTSYHFSMWTGYQNLAGKVWSPRRRTKTGRFIFLSDSLGDYCENRTSENLKKIKENLKVVKASL